MLRKFIAINKTYYVNWAPDDVCFLLRFKSIKAEQLIQASKPITNKLIREFYLLACRASLNSAEIQNKKALMLSNYAKAIKQVSNDYEILFRRSSMTKTVNVTTEESTVNSIDRLQARLFYLITQYSVHPCTHIADHIVKQLTNLCQHPHIELMPAQHYIYSLSINYWRSRLVNNCIPINKQELH
jgi:hypothetical protein